MSEYRAYIGDTSRGMEKTIHDALDYIQWEKSVYPDSVVFVKPNFTYPYYKEGITTSPALLKPLLRILKGRARRVIVGESDGGNRSFSADTAFKNHGMPETCGECGIELVNLSRIPSTVVEQTVAGKKVRVTLPELLLKEVDCFVDVPVLKVHVMTGVTLGLKNMWGCFPDTMRGLYHQNFARRISLIAGALKPGITLIDATYGLDKHGPMWGEAVKLDLILAANNVLAADALGASIMGFDPERIEHLRVAARTIPGTIDLKAVTINRDWKTYRRKFTIHKTLIDRFAWLLFNSEALSKLVFSSQFTKIIYAVGTRLRSSKEKHTAADLKSRSYFH